jgi:hypothetical protein
MDDSPIFITGTFRSGTTLVSQIIKNHPDVNLMYDSVNFMRFSFNDKPLDTKEAKKILLEIKKRVKKRYDLDFNISIVTKSMKRITYRELYGALMYELLLKNTKTKIWGEKTTLAWTRIPGFLKMFPKGRVVHVIRDPRAILASWKKLTHAPGNDYLDAILNCRGSMEKATEYTTRKNKRKFSRYHILRYEDLITSPRATVRKMCNKLKLKFHPDMVDPSKFKNKSGKKWKGNSIFKNDLNGFSKEMIDRWKKQLSDWEIWLSDFLNQDVMDKFGYRTYPLKNKPELKQIVTKNILSSRLVTDGVIRYMVDGKGHERFPMDPNDPNTWEKKYTDT